MLKVLFGMELLKEIARQIEKSERSIEVVMFEWSWYSGLSAGGVQDINRGLCIRAKRGLEVKVLLHNEAMGRALHRINRVTAGHLARSGVRVKWGNTGVPLHAKIWLFDRVRVVLGSHNISVRAVKTNEEVSALFDEPLEVSRVVVWFDGLWAKGM